MSQNILRQAIKEHQMMMARNIKNLSTKEAQKRQAHLLCRSLLSSLYGAQKCVEKSRS